MTLFRRPARCKAAAVITACFALSLLASCSQVKTPTPEQYLSAAAPPQVQELRWSNGRMPKSFDPARAAASPESDIACALYEGLTDIDPSNLDAVPAAAEKWSVSEDGRTWTFHLRRDAKWSSGKHVTAGDFVASWKRAAALGTRAAHPELLTNIVGLVASTESAKAPPEAKGAQQEEMSVKPVSPPPTNEPPTALPTPKLHEPDMKIQEERPKAEPLGLEALDDATLRITLVKPDNDLPKLLSDPLFRPVFGDGASFETTPLDSSLVTNGPFTVAEVGDASVTVQRSESYWNRSAVKLERIRFVPTETAEAALDAYKRGDLDAITNSDFEPLALKLLAPYGDFRQTTHNALNLYEFNVRSAPFNDRRVREALTVAVDRQRIVDSEFQGTAEAADDYLPITRAGDGSLDFDPTYARELLSRAGFPDGEGFPKVRLVINRNDVQQRVARQVARMWQQNLNIEAEVIVKEPAEMDAIRSAGEYDVIRRGVVLPTADERATLAAVFSTTVPPTGLTGEPEIEPVRVPRAGEAETLHGPYITDKAPAVPRVAAPVVVTSAADALYEMYSIPLYSPNAYSLVKPYVHGLQITGLNSVSFKNISIDNTWSAPKPGQQ